MPTATISPISDAHSRRLSITRPVVRPESNEADRLGDQITKLCSYLHAAEARLLTLIREFDCEGVLGRAGILFLCSLAQFQVRHRHERGSGKGAGGKVSG